MQTPSFLRKRVAIFYFNGRPGLAQTKEMERLVRKAIDAGLETDVIPCDCLPCVRLGSMISSCGLYNEEGIAWLDALLDHEIVSRKLAKLTPANAAPSDMTDT